MAEQPMGLVDRVKSAGSVLLTGKLPNPLAGEPADRSRAAQVKELNDWCLNERAFWKPVFDRVRQEQKFAAGKQWHGQRFTTEGDEDYIGDMCQQMVNRKTASLYSKNPLPEAILRDRMVFTVWDGTQTTLDNCQALIAQVAPQALAAHTAEAQGQPVDQPPPQMVADMQKAQQILSDYQRGMQAKKLLERVAETGEKLIRQQWDAQEPDFLVMAKQAVTRIITSRVAYIKVMYKRDLEVVPADAANTMDFADKLATLSARLKALSSETFPDDDQRHAEIQQLQASIQQEMADGQNGAEVAGNEGIVLDWLAATSVIVDRRCTCLKEFVKAKRIAHEMIMTVEECEATYGVSLRDSGAKLYAATGDGWQTDDRSDAQNATTGEADARFARQKVCVWEIQDKGTGMTYTVCDGVKDFLKEPEDNYPKVNRFWTIIPITFNTQEIEINDPENDATIFPRSDVRLMMPMQLNVNTAGQEKRKHRAANRPAWVGVKSKFVSTAGQNDLEKLSKPRNAHDVLMLENLQPGERIPDFIQPLPKQVMDPALYDTSQDSQAMMLATGQQPSDIGAQRPDEKATGQNIAAQARAASEASNIDDLNFAFGTLAQMNWKILVQEMPSGTVQKLVGAGAVWPELNREQVARSIFFKIEAGSMGRPNQAAEIQKLQVLGPQILDMFKLLGRSPEPLLKLFLKVYDANIDLDSLLAEAQVQAPPPAPTGADNAPKPPSLSLSMNFKDLPPEEQDQAVKFFGMTPADPQSRILQKVGHGVAAAQAG
ncbi:MAG TPA: hypothetical protein VGO57_14120 [Verrucomicrobiae bacterium]|jgi:hypothetical protein